MIATHHQYYSGYKLMLRFAANRSVCGCLSVCLSVTASIFAKVATDRRRYVRFPTPNFAPMGQAVRSARVRVQLFTLLKCEYLYLHTPPQHVHLIKL